MLRSVQEGALGGFSIMGISSMPSVYFLMSFCSALPQTSFSRIQVCGPEIQALSERPRVHLQHGTPVPSRKCTCHFQS